MTRAVLLVDDDEDILAALEYQIQSVIPGLLVVLRQDAARALEAMRDHRFALVISDYRLRSDIDGAELLRRAKDLQPTARLVAMASDPDQYLLERSHRDGFIVLAKPIDDLLLEALLRNSLG